MIKNQIIFIIVATQQIMSTVTSIGIRFFTVPIKTVINMNDIKIMIPKAQKIAIMYFIHFKPAMYINNGTM